MSAFVVKVKENVETFTIPPSMIVNCDETGAKMILVNNWTLAQCGSRQVDIVGSDDKREITVLLSVSSVGQLLPPN